MSLLERIRACTTHDPHGYVPLHVDGLRYGAARRDLVAWLAQPGGAFHLERGVLLLQPDLRGYAARSAAVHEALVDLRARGVLQGWWDEPSPVVRAWGEEPVMEVERAGLDALGLRAFGVHCNGWVRTPRGPAMWVARRAWGKGTYPGELDQLAAGGQPVRLDPRKNMQKECAEEAGVPARLAQRLVAAGSLSYRCTQPHGLNDDTIFCFDLELPASFVPRNEDGEVDSFELVPVPRLLERLRGEEPFKFNVAPVMLDFVLRHDLLARDDPEHAALAAALDALRGPGAPGP